MFLPILLHHSLDWLVSRRCSLNKPVETFFLRHETAWRVARCPKDSSTLTILLAPIAEPQLFRTPALSHLCAKRGTHSTRFVFINYRIIVIITFVNVRISVKLQWKISKLIYLRSVFPREDRLSGHVEVETRMAPSRLGLCRSRNQQRCILESSRILRFFFL